MRAGLPETDRGAKRVAEDEHAPRIEDVEGAGHHLPAQLCDARRDRVDIIDGDVLIPIRGDAHLLHFIVHAVGGGDIFAIERIHGIDHALADGDIDVRPAEQGGEESFAGFRIGALQLCPGKGAVRIFRHFVHIVSPRCGRAILEHMRENARAATLQFSNYSSSAGA